SMMDSAEQPRPTVLVVDDDPRIREMLPRILELEGYVVESAADGPAAIFRLARGEIDLMMLDLMMPGVDGLAVCREVRAHTPPATPYLPIIMLTGRTEVADQRAGFAAGADDYIVKPFSV